MPNDTLPWGVQKRLNRSICCLGCGLGWAEGSTSYIVFTRLHQCDLMGGHTGATWWIWLNPPSVAVMRPYVKLLWPLVIILVNSHFAGSLYFLCTSILEQNVWDKLQRFFYSWRKRHSSLYAGSPMIVLRNEIKQKISKCQLTKRSF